MSRALKFIGFERRTSNLASSVEFYRKALGFEIEAQTPNDVLLGLGRESIRLVRGHVAPLRSGVGFHHFAIVTNDMQGAFDRLQTFGATAISRDGYRHLPASSGGVQAFKFRDPDGHPLELIAFPRSSDDDAHLRWTEMGTDALTLGIDHSAIVVSNAQASIDFYEATLAMKVSSRQINHGLEQSLLDGLDGAVVDVVGLSVASKDSPHLELLCYDSPAGLRARTSIDASSADRMIFLVDYLENENQRSIVDPDGYPLELITR